MPPPELFTQRWVWGWIWGTDSTAVTPILPTPPALLLPSAGRERCPFNIKASLCKPTEQNEVCKQLSPAQVRAWLNPPGQGPAPWSRCCATRGGVWGGMNAPALSHVLLRCSNICFGKLCLALSPTAKAGPNC